MKIKSKTPPKNKETEEKGTPYFKWHKKLGFTIAGYINEDKNKA